MWCRARTHKRRYSSFLVGNEERTGRRGTGGGEGRELGCGRWYVNHVAQRHIGFHSIPVPVSTDQLAKERGVSISGECFVVA
jgi:hypothetical protein